MSNTIVLLPVHTKQGKCSVIQLQPNVIQSGQYEQNPVGNSWPYGKTSPETNIPMLKTSCQAKIMSIVMHEVV